MDMCRQSIFMGKQLIVEKGQSVRHEEVKLNHQVQHNHQKMNPPILGTPFATKPIVVQKTKPNDLLSDQTESINVRVQAYVDVRQFDNIGSWVSLHT
jgi:hypothetical protein